MFPVAVQTAAGDVFTMAKVWADDDRVEVWVVTGSGPTLAAAGTGPVKQKRGVGARFTDGTRARWTLELGDGSEWMVSPGGGCGCSHPLRNWNPAEAAR